MILIVILTFMVSLVAIFGVMRYAHGSQFMMDVPNHRSSHDVPTPRGGGLGFIFAMYAGMLGYFHSVPFLWLFVPVIGVTAIGYADDLRNMSARTRFLGQILFAAIAVDWANLGINCIQLLAITLAFSPYMGFALAVFFVVAMINIYNFMDGIDGLAGGLGVISAGFFGVFFYMTGQTELMMVQLLLMASLLGFIVWNYPKASVFMGDVGAYFLGFYFAMMTLFVSQGMGAHSISIFVPTAWLAVIGVDATLTIVWRMIKRKRIWEAHREHFFQKLHVSGWGHQEIIWLEYAHAVFVGMLGFWYMTVGAVAGWAIIVGALCSFFIKFLWIQYRWNNTHGD